MRIRRNAARLLGGRSICFFPTASPPAEAAAQSELLMPPPPLYMEPRSAAESCVVGDLTRPATATEGPCQLSCHAWDFFNELFISGPQGEDEFEDKYFYSLPCRDGWLVGADGPITSVKEKQNAVDGDSTASQPLQEVHKKKVLKKLAVSKKKQSEPKKKANVKKEDDQEAKQLSYKCKKNDGRRWQCHRLVSRPNSLCDYHFYKKGAHHNSEFDALAAIEAEGVRSADAQMEVPLGAPISKRATNSKPRKKKPSHDFSATEGFYYYAGFGPCRSKRNCTSNTSMNKYVPLKKEEEPAEDGSPTNEKAQAASEDMIQQAASPDGRSGDDAFVDIAGIDEDNSDDHYELGTYGSGENKVTNNVGGKMNKRWAKRQRKPVKERSLKSLM